MEKTAWARRWNWKAALFSSLYRGGVFFAVNLGAGVHAALGAMSAEFAYRGITAGFYGAMTQAASRSSPRRTAAVMAAILTCSHGLEFAVHRLRGTPHLLASIAVSVLFTLLSTLFNLHAMRTGLLLTGPEEASFLEDLRRIPGAIVSFGEFLIQRIKQILERTFHSRVTKSTPGVKPVRATFVA